MDFQRPVEALIPGAAGRLLAALARGDTELPISTLATVAAVGRTRASGLIAQLHDLGVVDRREIGRTTMVSLARASITAKISSTRRPQVASRARRAAFTIPTAATRRPISGRPTDPITDPPLLL